MMDASSARADSEPEGTHRVRQQQRRARTSQGLTELFAERSELRGVSPVADFFVDAVPWSA